MSEIRINWGLVLVLYLSWCLLPLTASGQYSLGLSAFYGGSLEDEGHAIAVSDSGYLLVGGRSFSDDQYLNSNLGGSDYWVMQMTTDGDTLWSRSFGGFHNDDLVAITESTDHRIAAFGTTRSEGGDVGFNPGVIGAWLLTLDAGGNKLSTRVYSGALGALGVDMIPMLDGGYTLLVESTSPTLEGAVNNGNFDIWVSRVNPNGSPFWTEFYGGQEADIAGRIQRVPGGGFLVAGSSSSSDGDVTVNKGGFDYWVFQIDINGELMWQRTFGGSGDDIASDLVVLEDGSMIVCGTSNSSDGDKSIAYGGDDVWLVGLNSQGMLEWEETLGGTQDDRGSRLHVVDNNELVLLAQSESSNVDLTGNKGMEDLWVVIIDGSGTILQQNNYGGSDDDFGRALTSTSDDRVFICGSSLSTGDNLPSSSFGGEDLWLLETGVDTAICSENFECFVMDVGSGVVEVQSNGPIACSNGCNVNGSQGPSGNGCQGFNGPVSWYKIRTDNTAEVMTVVVESAEFNRPQIAVMQSLNCVQFDKYECAIGTNGRVELVNIEVEPDTAYYVVVGDADGLTGEFFLCASALSVNFCNKNPSLYVARTSLGSSLNGPYKPGEEITFCYEVPNWDKLECNGIQGIQPTFGEGWDSTSFNGLGEPVDVDTMLVPIANGNWDWWPLGSVRYNFTNVALGYPGGVALPGGWYFINDDDPPPNNDPDESIGDLLDCDSDSSMWKVCFTLKAPENCTDNIDLSVTMKTFADGEIGSVVNMACQYDPPTSWTGVVNCCINPFIFPVPNRTICSGDTVSVLFESTLNNPVLYTWDVTTSANIVGAEDGVGPFLFQELINLGTEPELVTYTVNASNPFCETDEISFNVVVLPPPTATMNLLSPLSVCEGDSILLEFTFEGQPPYITSFSLNGVEQDEFLSEVPVAQAYFVPETSGLLSLSSYSDAMCTGNTTGAFNIQVLPVPSQDIVTSICESESVIVDGQAYNLAGIYNIIIENGASNGCDSLVNLDLTVHDEEFTSLERTICMGDSIVIGNNVYKESGGYLDTLQTVNGCDSVVSLSLEVTNQIVETMNEVICAGESFEFAGQVLTQGGTYFDTIPVTETCDSLRVLNLNVLSNLMLTQTVIEPDTGQNSGSISIMVGGSIPPYSYLWSTGDTTTMISGLASAEYMLTVTDFIGCSEVFDFFVTTSVQDVIIGVESLEVFPNPAQQSKEVHLKLQTTSLFNGTLRIGLSGLNGKRYQSSMISGIVPGENIFTLLLDGYIPGIYFLSVEDVDTGAQMTRRLVVK